MLLLFSRNITCLEYQWYPRYNFPWYSRNLWQVQTVFVSNKTSAATSLRKMGTTTVITQILWSKIISLIETIRTFLTQRPALWLVFSQKTRNLSPFIYRYLTSQAMPRSFLDQVMHHPQELHQRLDKPCNSATFQVSLNHRIEHVLCQPLLDQVSSTTSRTTLHFCASSCAVYWRPWIGFVCDNCWTCSAVNLSSWNWATNSRLTSFGGFQTFTTTDDWKYTVRKIAFAFCWYLHQFHGK